ncbi:hypothetical protein BH10PSE12_BH10PSE12_01880 [soil metagenome]
MKNFLQSGENLSMPVPVAVSSGQGVLIGAIFGIASTDAPAGGACAIVRRGVFGLAKPASQAWAIGAKIYWDNTNKLATNVSSGNTFIGATIQAVAGGASDTQGWVLLTGPHP